MATTRIKDITTTASQAASDDYLALDGTTNGTRKILAGDLGGSTLVIEVSGTEYEVTGLEAATVSGVSGVFVYYDDGNNGSIFIPDGVGMNNVKQAIEAEIPTKTSDLTNDSDFVESTDLATVATSGSYDDLSNKPTIPSLTGYQTQAITDTGGYYTTDTVESALQEIGAEIAGVNTLIGTGVIS